MSTNIIHSLSVARSRLARSATSKKLALPNGRGVRANSSGRVLSLSSQWLVLGSGEAVSNVEQDLQRVLPSLTIASLTEPLFSLEGSANGWAGVIVTQPAEVTEQHAKRLQQLQLQGIAIYDLPSFYEAFYLKLPSAYLRGCLGSSNRYS
jgi:hypothetical protein